jgi:inositol phosphorylceramide mannosyltransferase catalytic subunit
VLIPRIFHQIWVGPDPFPEEFAAYQQTWIDHHPDWELRFWTEENLPPASELRRPEVAERLRAPWERADILRLEVVWRHGGVHVDTDFECLRPIESLIANAEFFIGLAKKGRVNGAIYGARAGHPILDRALDEIQPRTAYGASMGAGGEYDKAEVGPKFLDAVLESEEGVTYIEPPAFFPRTLEQRGSAYATHHRARSWKDSEQLRRELEKFEGLVQEQQLEARAWKAHYKRAAAELEALRG